MTYILPGDEYVGPKTPRRRICVEGELCERVQSGKRATQSFRCCEKDNAEHHVTPRRINNHQINDTMGPEWSGQCAQRHPRGPEYQKTNDPKPRHVHDICRIFVAFLHVLIFTVFSKVFNTQSINSAEHARCIYAFIDRLVGKSILDYLHNTLAKLPDSKTSVV